MGLLGWHRHAGQWQSPMEGVLVAAASPIRDSPFDFFLSAACAHQNHSSRWLQTTSGKRIMDGVVLVQRIVGCEG